MLYLSTANKGLNSCHIDGQNKAIGLVPPGVGNSMAMLWILNTTRFNLQGLADAILLANSLRNDNFWRRIFPPIEDINQLLSERSFLRRTFAEIVRKFSSLVESKTASPCLKMMLLVYYPEPDESSSHSHIIFIKILLVLSLHLFLDLWNCLFPLNFYTVFMYFSCFQVVLHKQQLLSHLFHLVLWLI